MKGSLKIYYGALRGGCWGWGAVLLLMMFLVECGAGALEKGS